MRACRILRRRAIVRRREHRRVGSRRPSRTVPVVVTAAAVVLTCGYLAVVGDWIPGGEPRRVFKKISPSIVLIRQVFGHGSGVVLNPEGLIVTNHHVVDGATEISVSALVHEKGRIVHRTFKKATVVGVHPEYDAALVKVTAPGVRFFPATLDQVRNGVQTGESCYVIGNPGAIHVGPLRNTITPGIVSASKRRMKGLDYIQTSAAINGGNSVGALCDSSGRVIGIVTFTLWRS